MTLNRRNFLGTAISGAALTASGGIFSSFTSESSTEKRKKDSQILKISCQEGVAPGKELNEKLDFIESLGIVGIEFWGGGLEKRINEIQQALKNRNIKYSATCAGFEGWLISDDPAIQKRCMDSMKTIIAASGELGSTGVIFVPAFNNQKSLPDKEARELLLGQMKELGDYALQNKTHLDDGLKWINAAIAQNTSFTTLSTKSAILKEMGRNAEADSAMNNAMTMATNNELNAYGYQLLNSGQHEKAIEVLLLNTKKFPKDPNTFDSLGEAYFTKGDKKNAIINFKKSLSMNPPAAVRANSEKYMQQFGAK